MKVIVMILLLVSVMGCTPRILNIPLKSEGTMYASAGAFEYAVIRGKFEMQDQTNAQVAVVGQSGLRIGTIESVIAGRLLKDNISTVTRDELAALTAEHRTRALVVEFGVSGRNPQGKKDAYSQEVIVLIKNFATGELVYKGVGEYMGSTEIDDVKGAILAALENFGN